MSGSVDIGTLQGTIAVRNAYSAEFDKFNREAREKLVGGIKDFSEATAKETKRIKADYDRLASSLDPVIANTLKLQRAEQSLSAALKAGIIDQARHAQLLASAKEKYLGASASTLTWREEIQRLTAVISPFATRLANISVLAKEVQGALLGSSAAATSAAGSAATATTSLSALYAAALPIAAVLAALALAAGSVFVAFKGLSIFSSITQEGVQTQLVIERLNNTLKSTGSYAQMSSAQLVTLAESYELLSGKSKEEIIAAETILARFQTLNQETYPQALSVTLAYAKAMGVSADAAASKLGPALEGNTRALGSLKEAGIVLSQAQRKTLQDMIDTGEVAEYQATLFAILREKVGELSDEYDKNLSRQVERAKIVLNDFGESIANEVIPAIEDVVNEIVISLGGWDKLKAKVNEVGGAIGNFIRTSIYGLAIAYHELMATFDTLVAVITKGASQIAKAHGLIRGSLGSLKISKELSDISKDAASSALGHAEAIRRLREGLLEHRKALEGNTQVYGTYGSAIGDVIGKNRELEKSLEELTEIYVQNSEQLKYIYDLRMLATTGPLSRDDRVAKEKEINQLYKDRLEFLKLEEKFGTAVAKSLMEVKKQLRDLEFKAKIELELATKLEPIRIDRKDVFRFADESLKEAIKRLDLVIEIEKNNTAEFQATKDSHDQWVEGIASSWIENFRTMKDIAEGEMEAVREAVEEGLLSAAEGERALAQIRAEVYAAQIDKWSGFVGTVSSMLSELGGSLGKFFSQIGQITSSVQNVNQTASSLGGWSSAMGAWGGTIAAFVELYKFADGIIQKHKSEKYGTSGGVARTNSIDVMSYTGSLQTSIGQANLEVARLISESIRGFEDALRIGIDDLAAIEIKVRNDGKSVQAFVKGVWVGTFSDVQSAIQAALLEAIQDPDSSLRGMSDLMREGLSTWTSPDMSGLMDFLGKLRSISDLNLSPSVIALQQSFVEINRLRQALNQLDQSTQAVIDAQNDLTSAQNYAYSQLKNQLLGVDTAAADAIRNLAGVQAGMGALSDTASQGLVSALAAAEGQLRALERAATGLPSGTAGGQGIAGPQDPGIQVHTIIKYFSDALGDAASEITEEITRLKKAIEGYKEQLGKIPKALTEEELNLGIFTAFEQDMRNSGKYAEEIAKFEAIRVRLRYEEIKLQLIGIGLWQQWAGIWQDLYNDALANLGRAPRPGRGAGGGSSGKDNVRDFIKDKEFDLSLNGLTDYQKALKELDRQYDDLMKQAGNDKKLKEQLLDLKKEELRLLRQEAAAQTQGKFREFMGLVTPFDKVRKTAADLVKEIEGSPFGDARKAAMIGRVMAEVEKQIERMSKEMQVDLFGKMLGDMQRFGATDQQMLAARQAMAILEHELKMADYLMTITQLELEGKISRENLAILKEAYGFLEGIDPTLFLTPPEPPAPPVTESGGMGGTDYGYQSPTGGINSAQEYNDLLGTIRDQLAEWNRIPLSETLSRAHEITDSFEKVMEDIQTLSEINPAGVVGLAEEAEEALQGLIRDFIDTTLEEFEESGSELENQLGAIRDKFQDINDAFIHLGATQEDLQRAEVARLKAVKDVVDQWLDPIRDYRESRQIGQSSTLTSEQQFNLAKERFQKVYAEIQAGDLTNLGEVVGLAQQYDELLQTSTGGEGLRTGLSEIDQALLNIETLVPGFAAQMAEIGTETNPMYVVDILSADQLSKVTGLQDDFLKEMRGGTIDVLQAHNDNVEMRKREVLEFRRKSEQDDKHSRQMIEVLKDSIDDGTEAVNVGNRLTLQELRDTLGEIRDQNKKLGRIEVALDHPILVAALA